MVFSMTGYGRSEHTFEMHKVLVEMKAVNHRYCDIVLKIPKKMAMFEDRIKRLIKEQVKRGRVEVYMNFEEQKGDDFIVKPNFALLDQYKSALTEIKERYGIQRDFDLNLMTKFQDVFILEYKEVDEEAIWQMIEPSVKDALTAMTEMRRIEGQKLYEDIQSRVLTIKGIIVELEKRAPEIVVIHKNKMRERIQEILGDVEVDEMKLVQEVAYFADKTNITEELVRLDSHLDQLAGIFTEDQSIGRKLDFLLQEINREINTIGSKSPDIEISNFVVDLKSEFEKIREQIQNIE